MTRSETLPDFLEGAFDQARLEALPSSVAVIDAGGALLWTNPGWHRFAAENGAGGASAGWTSYFAEISQPLRAFYEEAFAEALATGEVFEQQYECSSPETRRYFHLRALPIRGRGLVLDHALVRELPQPDSGEVPIEEDYRDARGLIAQCSNCRRVESPADGAFHWIPAWVASPHPQISHVLCPTCVGFYWGLRPRRKRR